MALRWRLLLGVGLAPRAGQDWAPLATACEGRLATRSGHSAISIAAIQESIQARSLEGLPARHNSVGEPTPNRTHCILC